MINLAFLFSNVKIKILKKIDWTNKNVTMTY